MALESAESRWLFDPARSAFQNIAHEMDISRAIAFGVWEPYTNLSWQDDETLIIVRSGPRARLKVQVTACPMAVQ